MNEEQESVVWMISLVIAVVMIVYMVHALITLPGLP